MRDANSDTNSRRLLLIYSVECGLKYMLLNKWCENNPQKIFEGNDEAKKDILRSHNLKNLIKEVGQMGNFSLPQLETVHNEQVSSEMYHQMYRYCIRVVEKDNEKECSIENTLQNVAAWIGERM